LDERTLESQHPTYLRSLLGKNAAKKETPSGKLQGTKS
jgi:hypothetical protein